MPPTTSAMVEPFTGDYLWLDIYRVVLAAAALWLALLVLRLMVNRWKDMRSGGLGRGPHPATHASYALTLIAIGGFRIEGLGTGPDLRMWIGTAVVALGLWGVLYKVRFDLKPPHRRHR